MARDESENPEYSKRLLRGHQMIENGFEPKQLSQNRFEIPSQSKDLNYIVTSYANSWSCTCPDYEFRHVTCKHIHAVTLWQRLSKKIEEDHKEKSVFAVTLNSGIACKFCNSTEIIKYGKANDKQVYFCKSCARKFVPNEGFEGMKYDPRIVTTTLDLYFKDVSLRKIADHLKQCHSLDIDHSTVYRWISKYTDIIEAYVATLEPELGGIWHTDEMKIKIGGEWHWLWNVMDERTRFHLVSIITKTREIGDAKKAFKKSKEVGNKKPELMVTDGLQSYKKAFNSEFYDHHQSCKHIADVALQESLNNVLERMHGTIREREKIMRGIKVDDTPIIPMNKIYYNFVRPHMGLDEATPAEAAGVGIGGENKWMELLKKSIPQA
ncbi:MAG: IS6 family transposase [Methanothrix sp.]|nr:IS6 family transposase [Methanothrix sp.]